MAIEGLSIGLYLDHNADDRFAVLARQHGYRVVVARDVDNALASDPEQLAHAATSRLCLLTHDVDDFPVLARQWDADGRNHSGIILAAQPGRKTSFGVLGRRLLRLLETLSADDMINRVECLDRRWGVDDNS